MQGHDAKPTVKGETDEEILRSLQARFEGKIQSIEPSRDRGQVLTRDGRSLPFDCGNLVVKGSVLRPDALKAGMLVTFDLSHTTRGPKVTHIWVGDGPWNDVASQSFDPDAIAPSTSST